MQMQFEVIFASVWVRLERFLPPFGSVFASFFDRLGFASAHASAHVSAHACASESANAIANGSANSNARASANLNMATDGMSIIT